MLSMNFYPQKTDVIAHEHTNALKNETSPYLLQHAHNPVKLGNLESWGIGKS